MTRTRRQHDLERAAIHQAEHAVVAYVIGIKVERISIEQAGSSAGHVAVRSFKHHRFGGPRARWVRGRGGAS